jgi:DNA-binding MarR family transcriptional regulator
MIEKIIGRKELLKQLDEEMRQMSTWTVLFHSAIAEQVDLNVTDQKCLDILNQHGPLAAGQLADITGLTTGAITGVIDRLEKAGYVHRERDPHDRRRVIVQPTLEKVAQDLGPIFTHLQQRYLPLLENYQEDELNLLICFFQGSVRFLQEEINWLRQRESKDIRQ